jgi:hypothetical protein
MGSESSLVVKLWSYHPKVKSLSPATSTDIGRDEIKKPRVSSSCNRVAQQFPNGKKSL